MNHTFAVVSSIVLFVVGMLVINYYDNTNNWLGRLIDDKIISTILLSLFVLLYFLVCLMIVENREMKDVYKHLTSQGYSLRKISQGSVHPVYNFGNTSSPVSLVVTSDTYAYFDKDGKMTYWEDGTLVDKEY